jgi:hypothetical protein
VLSLVYLSSSLAEACEAIINPPPTVRGIRSLSSYQNIDYHHEIQPILVEEPKLDKNKQQRDHPEHSPYDATGYALHYPSPPPKEVKSGEVSKVRTVTPEEKNKLNSVTTKV